MLKQILLGLLTLVVLAICIAEALYLLKIEPVYGIVNSLLLPKTLSLISQIQTNLTAFLGGIAAFASLAFTAFKVTSSNTAVKNAQTTANEVVLSQVHDAAVRQQELLDQVDTQNNTITTLQGQLDALKASQSNYDNMQGDIDTLEGQLQTTITQRNMLDSQLSRLLNDPLYIAFKQSQIQTVIP